MPTTAHGVPIVIPGDDEADRRRQDRPRTGSIAARAMRSDSQPQAHHSDCAADVWNHRHPAHLHVGDAELLYDLRQEQQHAKAGRDDADIVQRQQQHLGIPERAQQANRATPRSGGARSSMRPVSQALSSSAEPARLGGPVGHVEEHGDADQDCRDASRMYIHCQPARPHRPSSPRSAVEIGAPVATAIGSASVNPEMMRARCWSGNQ